MLAPWPRRARHDIGALVIAGAGRSWGLALVLLTVVGCGRHVAQRPAERVESARDTLRLSFGGDVMFGRVGTGEAPTWRPWPGERALTQLAPRFEQADLAVVNLESPLCTDPTAVPRRQGVVLAGPLEAATWLGNAGIDVAIVANNHGLDCGEQGLADTEASLRNAGVVAVGIIEADAPPPAVARTDLERVTILAVSERAVPGTRPGTRRPASITDHAALERTLVAAVATARAERPDAVIVVSVHWGLEMQPRPAGAQTALARALVDAGAHVVMGHHPHVVQPIEVHGRGVIAYSLGNLWFDMSHPAARRTGILDVTLERGADGWRVDTFSWHGLQQRALP